MAKCPLLADSVEKLGGKISGLFARKILLATVRFWTFEGDNFAQNRTLAGVSEPAKPGAEEATEFFNRIGQKRTLGQGD